MNESLVDILSSIALKSDSPGSPLSPSHSHSRSHSSESSSSFLDPIDDPDFSKDQEGLNVFETLQDQVDQDEFFYDDPALPASEQGSNILAQVISEFGPMPDYYGPERVIVQKTGMLLTFFASISHSACTLMSSFNSYQGNLYRTVIVSGIVTMTNHRITYSAKLPPFERGRIIKSGMVTYHRSGLHRKRRLWAELRSDSASMFYIYLFKAILLCPFYPCF